MTTAIDVRPVRTEDFDAWRVLWDGYNAFYGRLGATSDGASLATGWW